MSSKSFETVPVRVTAGRVYVAELLPAHLQDLYKELRSLGAYNWYDLWDDERADPVWCHIQIPSVLRLVAKGKDRQEALERLMKSWNNSPDREQIIFQILANRVHVQ
jgi:hypothetical protein